MIKILRFTCGATLALFVILIIYGNNKFQSPQYNEQSFINYHETMIYEHYMSGYPELQDIIIDDTKVQTLSDLVEESEYVLKVIAEEDKIIKGEGILNKCIVLDDLNGEGSLVNQTIYIYDHALFIYDDSSLYFDGAKSLEPNKEYIVFLKKAPNPNMQDTYIFSSINFGSFMIDGNQNYITNYENASILIADTWDYGYIAESDDFIDLYFKFQQQLDNGIRIE